MVVPEASGPGTRARWSAAETIPRNPQRMPVCGTETHRLLLCRHRSGAFPPRRVHKFPESCGHALGPTSMHVPAWTAVVVMPRCDPVTSPVQRRIRRTGGVPSLRPAGQPAGLDRDSFGTPSTNEAWGRASRRDSAAVCPEGRAKHRTLTRPYAARWHPMCLDYAVGLPATAGRGRSSVRWGLRHFAKGV